MRQTSRLILCFTVMFLTACLPVLAQRRAGGGGHAAYSSGGGSVYGRGGAYGGYGYGGYGYGGYGYYPTSGSGFYAAPNAMWGPYRSEFPCQAGCNPNAGYEWDSVGTLILDTNPPQARVTLNGIYAGTTDKLGPFQLPVGERALHIEAPGFEPTDIIVKFDQPGVQSLNVALKRTLASAQPAPQH
jgi:hypothetical protein